jgi:hypothetical protein
MHLTLKPGRKVMGRLAKGDDLRLGLVGWRRFKKN